MMPAPSPMLVDVTLAVLAGGAGARMGVAKGMLRVRGRPILEWLIDHFAWPGPTMLITAPGTAVPAGAERFDHVATDAVAGNGPLQGVLAALESAGTEVVVIVTVDMPRIDTPKLAWLCDRLMGDRAGVMCRATAGDERIEPFPCVLRRGAVGTVRQHLATHRRSVHGLCREASIVAVVAPPEWPADTWLNLNHPEQFAAFVAALPPA